MMENEGKYENLIDKSIGFEEFPNELLLKIFNFFEIVDLIKCSQTSKRIRDICYDDSLWQKINLSNKKVKTEFLQKVIDHGCKCLKLNEAKIIGTLRLKNKSQFTNLDLSGCTAVFRSVFEELLKSCHFLQTLTFTQEVNLGVMSQLTVQNGKTLQILNYWQGTQGRSLWNPTPLKLFTIECIIKNCPELKELTFWNGDKSSETYGNRCCWHEGNDVEYLVNNISPEIEKLGFGMPIGPFSVGDRRLKILVTRCTKLKELRVMGVITNESLKHIIDNLKATLEKLVIPWCESNGLGLPMGNFSVGKMRELKSMTKLKTLDLMTYVAYVDETDISELRIELPDVSVNWYDLEYF